MQMKSTRNDDACLGVFRDGVARRFEPYHMFILYNTLVRRRTIRVPCLFSAEQFRGKRSYRNFSPFLQTPRSVLFHGKFFPYAFYFAELVCAGRHPSFVIAL